MTDSIKVNNDVKIVTRYAMGLTPKEERVSILGPETIPTTIALEKGIRGTTSIFPDLMHPKKAFQEQKAIEQGLKGSNFKETYGNFTRNMDIQGLEKRFRGLSASELKEFKKLEGYEKIKNLTAEAKGLTGAARQAKIQELKTAVAEFKNANGFTTMKDAAAEIKKLNGQSFKKIQKSLINFRKTQMYDGVRQLIQDAKGLKGKDYANKMKEIQKAIADADLRVFKETTSGSLRPVTRRGKLWSGVKKATGYTTAKGGVETALTKSSKLRQMAKAGRANALTAVSIDLALAAPEIYATKETFDMIDEDGNYIHDQYDEEGNLIVKGSGKEAKGTEKALKQTGRVVTTAGAQVAAYAIGAKAGTAAVAALWAAKGAALGSVAPGVGTAIGAVVGLAVGLTASYFAGKAMESALGKSELDQLKDKTENQPAEELAIKAQSDDAILEEVLSAAQERYSKEPEENKVVEKAYENTVAAYKKGEIGINSPAAAALSSQETTAAGTDKKDKNETTPETGKTDASGETEDTNKPTKTSTTAEDKSKKDTKASDSAQCKYDRVIRMLDYYINAFGAKSTPSYSYPMCGFPQMMSPFMNYTMPGMYQFDFTI